MTPREVIVDVRSLYTDRAKTAGLMDYEEAARELAGEGNHVVLTGEGPIWLYLRLAHSLHGVARTLTYRSPVTGDVVVFDHSPD